MPRSVQFTALLSAAVALCQPVNSQGLFSPADGDFYVSGFVGAIFPDDEIGDLTFDGLEIGNDVYYGGALGGALPFKTFGVLQPRIEIEASYTELEIGIDDDLEALGFTTDLLPTAKVDAVFLFANSYADLVFSDDQFLVPYLGGGIGVVAAGDFGNGVTTELATNTSLGLTLPINRLDVYGEGRYQRVYNDGPDFDSFAVVGGLRIRF